jgi:hypothetical protein
MQLTGLEDLIGASNFYPSIRTAIEAFREDSLAGKEPEQNKIRE